MKISKLHIDQFRHLENLDFDFTYQSGERKGQPLDKICFIGQSATGKTSLLELINNDVIKFTNTDIDENSKIWHPAYNLDSNLEINIDKNKYRFANSNYYLNENLIEKSSLTSTWLGKLFENKFPIYYFKSNLISDKNIEIFTKNPIDLFEKHSGKPTFSLANIHNKRERTIESPTIFNDEVDSEIWLSLLSEILEYRKNFTQKMSELIHKGLLGDQKKLDVEYKKWQKENPNALESFAKEFNPILEKLNLEVDTINTEFSIPIKNKRTDEIIPIQNTSTGTKGLLLSFLPLFKLDTKDSIILIDEPERSLYPDMQMDLMDHYQKLAPEAQFIVATHSPFIAASFEADERFILYFDEEGKVAVRRGSSPIGDDPNDMLKNDFGVNYYNKYGEEAYKKYLKLKEDLAKEKDSTKKKKLLLETVKLGDIYNF